MSVLTTLLVSVLVACLIVAYIAARVKESSDKLYRNQYIERKTMFELDSMNEERFASSRW